MLRSIAAASVLLVAACPAPRPPPECEPAVLLAEEERASSAGASYWTVTATAEPSHVDFCDDTSWNLRAEADCTTATGRTIPSCEERDAGGGPDSSCARDADCADDERCAYSAYGFCSCVRAPCTSHDACRAGEVCVCSSGAPAAEGTFYSQTHRRLAVTHVCVTGECETGADCDSGECGVSRSYPCLGVLGAFCRTAQDTCHGQADCADTDCVYDPEVGHWRCLENTGTCE
jgi:hypothetical protein